MPRSAYEASTQALQLTDWFFVTMGIATLTALWRPGEDPYLSALPQRRSAYRKALTDALFNPQR